MSEANVWWMNDKGEWQMNDKRFRAIVYGDVVVVDELRDVVVVEENEVFWVVALRRVG